MENTQSSPNTANPQQAPSAGGASNAADFQSTAPSDALRTEMQNLSVQETGQPLEGGRSVASGSGSNGWIIVVVAMAVVAVFVIFKLIREAIEDNRATSARAAAPAASSSAKKKPATTKKASPAKKPAAKRKKKPATKKRK